MAKTSDLRVISGRYRGRSLVSPRHNHTHPMGAREKLALFNMVNVEQRRVLDAYAGSGALGIEALSRGASEVVFVEKSTQVCRVIRENLTALAENDCRLIFRESLRDFCQRAEYQGYFNVIFADPPYDHLQISELEQLSALLAQDGTLALSSPANIEPIELPNLRISSTHTYARARITIYRQGTSDS